MRSTARSLSAILAVAMLSPLATAQEICTLEVRTATVTECFPNTGTPVTPSCRASCPTPMASAKPNGPVFVEVVAPKCDSCGCDTCVHTNVYTTTYDVFCPAGIAQQEYVVTETYSGMSGKPTMPSAARVPFGFTAGVETCTECGKTPVTATLTYPASGCPYILGMSEPTGAPEGVPAYEVCTTGTGANGAEETAPIAGPTKSGPSSWSAPNSGGSGPGSSGSDSSSSPGSGAGSSPGSGSSGSGSSGSGSGSSGSGSGSSGSGSSGAGSGPGAAPGSSAAPGSNNNGGYETSPESGSGSAPALGSGAGAGSFGKGTAPAGSSGMSSGSGSSSVGSSGSGMGSGSSPVGSSGSSSGSGWSPAESSGSGEGWNIPSDTGSSETPAGTGTNGYSETSAGHPTFMAVTLGGVLGFFISFLAFTL